MTEETAKIIEDGLKWYEDNLWHEQPKSTKVQTNIEEETNQISGGE